MGCRVNYEPIPQKNVMIDRFHRPSSVGGNIQSWAMNGIEIVQYTPTPLKLLKMA